MIKKIQVLGISEYFSCVLYDLLKEQKLADHLDIFLNIDLELKPITPILEFPYSIFNKNVPPDPEIPMVLGVSGPKNKFPVFNFFSGIQNIKPSTFINLIHDSSSVADSTFISGGVVIEQNVVISSQTKMGFGVFVKRGASIGHHCMLGDFVDINPGAIISGRVNIGKGVVIGAGAVVIDGVQIGANSVIGAGSVVTKDIPDGVIAYGNPCKIIRDNKEWKI